MRVIEVSSSSLLASPAKDGFRGEPVQLSLDGKGDVSWVKVKAGASSPLEVLETQDLFLVAVKTGCTSMDRIKSYFEATGVSRDLTSMWGLTGESTYNLWSVKGRKVEDQVYAVGPKGEVQIAALKKEHTAAMEAALAVVANAAVTVEEEEGGEEEVEVEDEEVEAGEQLVISKMCAANLMVSAIDAGCGTRNSIDTLISTLDGRDMRPCHSEAAGKSYGGLWICKGPHSEYNLTEDGEKRVEALKAKYKGELEAAVAAAVAKSGDEEPEVETAEEEVGGEEESDEGHFLVCEGTNKCNAPGYSCWILDTSTNEFTGFKDKRLAKVLCYAEPRVL